MTQEKRRWEKLPSGDWAYVAGMGEDVVRLGTVVFQDLHGQRSWYSVSATKSHGPDEGGLTECKRRIEALWRDG